MNVQRETVDRRTLALWIEKGSAEQDVVEDCDHTIKAVVLASTLGLALIGKCGSKEEALKQWTECQKEEQESRSYKETLALLLDLPLEVVERISRLTYESVAAVEITRMLTEGEISY